MKMFLFWGGGRGLANASWDDAGVIGWKKEPIPEEFVSRHTEIRGIIPSRP